MNSLILYAADLINEVIEAHLAEEGEGFEIVRYPLPVDIRWKEPY